MPFLKSLLVIGILLPVACPSKGQIASKQNSGSAARKAVSSLMMKKNYFIREYPQEYFMVQCGLQDDNGSMWFGTAGNGIYCYDGKSFTNFTHRQGLNHDDILCCLRDNSRNIWFGTRNGVILYQPSKGKPGKEDFTCFLILENIIDPATGGRLPYTYRIAENFVWAIYQDRKGTIWFGTNRGIYIHNPSSRSNSVTPQFTRFLPKDGIHGRYDLSDKTVTGFGEDADGNMWVTSGYINGVGLFRYDGQTISNFKPDGVGSFRSIYTGRDGKLFFLSDFRGVYSYNGHDFTNITQKMGITNDTVVSMIQSVTGDFWFGLSSNDLLGAGRGGAWHCNKESRKLFTTKDGLSHNCVFCIVEDSRHSIWFGTRNTGLCRYDGNVFTDFTDR